MSDVAPFLVIGLVTGSLYGLAAAGLVLTFKTSGIFNFAHGAIGAGAAYVFYDLRDLVGVPAVLALAVTIGVVAPLCGLAMSVLAKQLESLSTARRVVATVGVLLVIQGAIELRYGIAPLALDSSLPTSSFRVAGVNVGYDQLITIVVSIVGLIVLEILFRRTQLGLRMRAVVDDDELVDLAGRSPVRTRAAAWVIGAAFASVSGVLLAPAVGLDALLLTLVVVQAFGAAAIGRFENVTLTFVGGLVIGIGASVLNAPALIDNIPAIGDLQGLDQSLPFLVLFAVLALTPRGGFAPEQLRRGFRPPNDLSRGRQLVVGALTVLAVAAAPASFATKLPVFTLGAVFVVIFASLHLLVEVSGQISLCHVAFVAIGATTFTHLTAGAGLPWLLGVAGAALVAVPIGASIAVPAIRLSGVYLALATFGFGILVERLLYLRGVMFGSLGSRVGSRPAFAGFDSDRGYFFLCVAFGAAAIYAVSRIRRGQLGRLLESLAESPVALVTNGTSVTTTRILVFCTSASMAAVGGALYVGVVGSVSSIGASSSALVSFNSLLWLAVLAFVGRSTVVSPVIAAIALVVAPSYVTSPDSAQYFTLSFGLIAIVVSAYGESIARAIARSGSSSELRRIHSPVRDRRLVEGVSGG